MPGTCADFGISWVARWLPFVTPHLRSRRPVWWFVQSARYGGPDATYEEKFRLIYDGLGAAGVDTSAARFVCALALAESGKVTFEARGLVEGRIASRPAGHGGFGYDPVFYYPPYGATLAEVDPARKSAVSHRGQAFRALRVFLQGLRD